jgi:hypothetical protein
MQLFMRIVSGWQIIPSGYAISWPELRQFAAANGYKARYVDVLRANCLIRQTTSDCLTLSVVGS